MKPEEIKLIKEFFEEEEKFIEDTIKYNEFINDKERVQHWEQALSINKRIKKALFNKLKIK